MKRQALKAYDKFIMVFLTLLMLLVAGCEEPEPDRPMPEYGAVPMYGVPASTISE